MFIQVTWDDVYKHWQYGRFQFGETLTSDIVAEKVFVSEHPKNCYIYGYDWLPNNIALERKAYVEKCPMGFLLSTNCTNKGTIQTIEMLMEAKSNEEIAAIWVAATAKELYEYRVNSSVTRYADALYMAADGFLRESFWLWHHAMKRLVPEIMIPRTILENLECKDIQTIVDIIQLNTVMLKNEYSVLLYSSLEDGKIPETYKHIRLDA